MNLEKLHNAIAAVCPIHGVSVGDGENKTTWTISFKDEATNEEKAAAHAVIDAADLSILDEPETYTPYEFLQRFTLEEQTAIEASTDIGVKLFLRKLSSVSVVIPDFQDTIDGMNYLVSKGLITEARKAEILS